MYVMYIENGIMGKAITPSNGQGLVCVWYFGP